MEKAEIRLWPSKNLIDVLNPDPSLIEPGDIAHSLGNICRYTGHIKYFYSVLQHQLQVANWIRVLGGSSIEQYTGLHHDDSEYLCNDLSSPLKKQLPEYKAIENNVQRVIAEKFNLPYPFPPIVHKADLLARAHEAWALKDDTSVEVDYAGAPFIILGDECYVIEKAIRNSISSPECKLDNHSLGVMRRAFVHMTKVKT
jgi:hypothetical protein